MSVSLVPYLDDEDEEDDAQQQQQQRPTSRTGTDTPESRREHMTPHVRGNWPTLVYIEAPQWDDLATDALADPAVARCAVWTPIEAGELHVSLSRTLLLKEFQIDGFVRDVGAALAAAKIASVRFWCSGLRIFPNDERLYQFAALLVTSADHRLLKCLRTVDEVVAAHGLPTYYEPPELHVSIGWAKTTQQPSPHTLERAYTRLRASSGGTMPVSEASAVVVRAGNRVFRIPL